MTVPLRVALLAGPETLTSAVPAVRERGVDLRRVVATTTKDLPATAWLDRVPTLSRFDTLVVTSRAGVRSGVAPLARRAGGRNLPSELWAVGSVTARALRRASGRRVRQPAVPTGAALARELVRTPGRSILYLRSREAGPELSRRLRRSGHRVVDMITYRLDRVPLRPADARWLQSTDAVVAGSASALRAVRRSASRAVWSHLRARRLIVLGPRSERGARRLGFADVRVVPPGTAQRFTSRLLEVLRDAER